MQMVKLEKHPFKVCCFEACYESWKKKLQRLFMQCPKNRMSLHRIFVGYRVVLNREFTGLAKSVQGWEEICQKPIQIDEMIYTKSRMRIPLSFLLEAVNREDDFEEAAEINRLRDKQVEVASSHISSHEVGVGPASISVSTGLSWLAAIKFLKENPSYLDEFRL